MILLLINILSKSMISFIVIQQSKQKNSRTENIFSSTKFNCCFFILIFKIKITEANLRIAK